MNTDFLNTLSGVDKVLYKSTYEFTEKYCNGTPVECHTEGLKKIKDTLRKFSFMCLLSSLTIVYASLGNISFFLGCH